MRQEAPYDSWSGARYGYLALKVVWRCRNSKGVSNLTGIQRTFPERLGTSKVRRQLIAALLYPMRAGPRKNRPSRCGH